MAINIFEGSRRIALIVAGLATIATLIALTTYEPYMSVSYMLHAPDQPLGPIDRSLLAAAHESFFRTKTSAGNSVDVSIYIKTLPPIEGGIRMIPYKVDEKGAIIGVELYSMEALNYERGLQHNFKFPNGEEKRLDDERARLYRKNFMEGIGWLILGLAIYATVIWVIGWITRGFLGIPNGKDRRPE